MNVKQLKEYLDTVPDEMEVYCVQDEIFSNKDRAPDYFPANLACFLVQNEILYIGDIEP